MRWALALCVGVSALWTVGGAQAGEKKPMLRTIDASGFHTVTAEKFWSRPLYGPNRRMFVPAGELPHASFMWFEAQTRAFVRCGHFLLA